MRIEHTLNEANFIERLAWHFVTILPSHGWSSLITGAIRETQQPRRQGPNSVPPLARNAIPASPHLFPTNPTGESKHN